MRILAVKEAYELWASTYDETPNPVATLAGRTACNIICGLAPERVIDVGCGTGSIWQGDTLRSLPSHVVGIDASASMLKTAARAVQRPIDWIQTDGIVLPLRTACTDFILCSLTLGYCVDLSSLFLEFSRISRPGAHVLAIDLHPVAVASGWTRSFQSNGHQYSIDHVNHSLEDLRAAAVNAGLALADQRDAFFGEPELPYFVAAGKADRFLTLVEMPALYSMLWQKLC